MRISSFINIRTNPKEPGLLHNRHGVEDAFGLHTCVQRPLHVRDQSPTANGLHVTLITSLPIGMLE